MPKTQYFLPRWPAKISVSYRLWCLRIPKYRPGWLARFIYYGFNKINYIHWSISLSVWPPPLYMLTILYIYIDFFTSFYALFFLSFYQTYIYSHIMCLMIGMWRFAVVLLHMYLWCVLCFFNVLSCDYFVRNEINEHIYIYTVPLTKGWRRTGNKQATEPVMVKLIEAIWRHNGRMSEGSGQSYIFAKIMWSSYSVSFDHGHLFCATRGSGSRKVTK